MPTIKILRAGAIDGLWFKEGEVRSDFHPARAKQFVERGLAVFEHEPKASSAHDHPPAEEASLDSDPPKRKRGRPRKTDT